MKTATLILGVIILHGFIGLNDAAGQWATSGDNIYNTNTGNVGIGTSSPSTLLDAAKNMTEPTISVRNLGGVGGATFSMIDDASGADWKFKATNSGGFKIRDNANLTDIIVIEPSISQYSIYIDEDGNVGMGTANPTQKLQITGKMKLRTSSPFIYLDNTNAAGNAGMIFQANGLYRGWLYYNDASDYLLMNAESGGGTRADLVIRSDGRICMGTLTAATGYKLSVNGKVACEEILVENNTTWPDYVFHEDYPLMPLPELEMSIRENKHLPGLPSAYEVQENGFQIADMQRRFLVKMEEMTLYIIDQGKLINELRSANLALSAQIEGLQRKMADLEKHISQY